MAATAGNMAERITEQMMEAAQQRSLVVGLGSTGLSCARYLAGLGDAVAITDSREQPPGLEVLQQELPQVAVFLGGFAPEAFEHAERIVVSPGVSVHEPLIAAARERGVEILGDVELFARIASAPIVAVTGSNGKSTVVSLLGEAARQAGQRVAVGGNIGTPVLDLLQQDTPDLYVLELSSFQLETTDSLHARAAVVLNISADHMDRYRDLQDYMAAKARIYSRADYQVVNDDDALAAMLADGARPQLHYSLGKPQGMNYGVCEIDGSAWLCRGDEALLAAAELRLAGAHNLSNALATLALAEAMEIPRSAVLAALKCFAGLPHRTQWVGEWNGVRWYNDSKGTNVGATVAALQGLPGAVILIAGGEGKGADFTPLAQALAGKARAVVLIGRDAPLIEAAINGQVPVVRAGNMVDAVEQARALAQAGDSVLLSPACASFDMFGNYAERGQVFMDAVRKVLT